MSSVSYRCILQTRKREHLDPAADTGVLERFQWAFVASHDDLYGLAGFSKYRRRKEEVHSVQKLASYRFFRSGFFGHQWPLDMHPFYRQLYCKTCNDCCRRFRKEK